MPKYVVLSVAVATLALVVYLVARGGSAGEEEDAEDEGRAAVEDRRRDRARVREAFTGMRGAQHPGPIREDGDGERGRAGPRTVGETEDRVEEAKAESERAWAREIVIKLQSATPVQLISFLDDPDPRVRQAAAQMIADRGAGGEDAARALIPRLADEWEPARQAAARALVRLGEAARPLLTEALESEDPLLRENARLALERIGS